MKEYQTSQRDCKTFFQVHKYCTLFKYYVVLKIVSPSGIDVYKGISAITHNIKSEANLCIVYK